MNSKCTTDVNNRNSTKSRLYDFLIPVFIILLVLGAHYFNVIKVIELQFYDLLLFLKEPPSDNNNITFITINEQLITEINHNYPLSRDIIANSLVLLKEFNAESEEFRDYLIETGKLNQG